MGIDICHKSQFYVGCLHGVVVKVLDCRIIQSEFKLQSCYYVHFWTNTLGKGMNPLILPSMGYLTVLEGWIWHWITQEGWYANICLCLPPDKTWLVGCVLWHIDHYGLFNAKSSLHIYIYMICKYILYIAHLTSHSSFTHPRVNGFKCFNQTWV